MSVNIFKKSDNSLQKLASNLYSDGSFQSLVTNVNTLSETKVNKTDVVNNLTSTDTNKPLSANMGKTLFEEKVNQEDVYGSEEYSATTSYSVGDMCIYDGKLWRCKVACSGQTPSESTYWTSVNINTLEQNIRNSNGYLDLTISALNTWNYADYPQGFNESNCFVSAIAYRSGSNWRYGIGTASTFTDGRFFVELATRINVYATEKALLNGDVRIVLQKYA